MSLKAIVTEIRDFIWELLPYIVTAFACINAAIAGIGFFGYEGRSALMLFGLFIGFVLALAAALFCLIQTVSHAFLYLFGKWLARTTFYLRNRNG